MPGLGNRVSLYEGQRNYQAFGAAERRNRGLTRTPVEGEERERDWRPLDLAQDNVERPGRGIDYADSYPEHDTTLLYYWRATYWRRLAG
jgi:Cysteine-rich CPCC